MAQDYQDITVDHEGAVAVLTLNRPAVVNALSARLLDEFHSAVRRLDEADSGVSVIVVTGAGDRAFSAWTDIHEMARLAEEGKPPPSASHVESNWSLAMARKPTIGALNGLCYGGGALLASLLDMRVGSHRTRFRFLAVTYGRINSTWLLPTLIGMPLAKELI